MSSVFCGIDFGTSNTTIGVSEAAGARLIPLEGDSATLPSAIFFRFLDAQALFGRAGIDAYVEGEDGRLMRALKSVLGTSLIHEKTRIQKRSMTFMEIIGVYFAFLKERLDSAAGQDVGQVVLGRPVRFVDGDDSADAAAQAALETIAHQQGFRHVSFQYEPIAAALDYEQQVRAEELVLIVDIGGGTSDFSIIRLSPERAKKPDRKDDILANAGVHIGGTDFDRMLSLAEVMPHFGYNSWTADRKRQLPSRYYHDLSTWHCINLLYERSVMTQLRQVRYEAERRDLVDRLIHIVADRHGHSLAMAVEAAKIALTSQDSAHISLADLVGGPDIGVTRAAFDASIGDGVGRIVRTVDGLLASAGLRAGDISSIFITGGTSSVPLLRARILAPFPAARSVEGNLLGSVGLGLSLDARRKFG